MNRPVVAGRIFAVIAFGLATAVGRGSDDASFSMLGNTMTVQVSGAQTHGTSSTIVVDIVPGHEPPMHVHTREDETYVVTRGRFRFFRGSETFDAGPGAVVYLPRNVPHTFKNLGTTPAQMVFTLTPAGLESMFRTISKRGLTMPKDIRAVVALGKDYGITYLPPKHP